MADTPPPHDSAHFRRVLGHFPTGVTVVTAQPEGGAPVGMAVGSFTSVSLDPPLVAFLPAKSSSTWPDIEKAGAFCVNVCAQDHGELSGNFASKKADKFEGVDWEPTAATGSPRLRDALAWVDCTIDAVHEAGDHWIVVGRVEGLDADAEGNGLPLVFFKGAYGRFEG
ncbi:MAG: flavin reductase family protein [Actinomycetota bacterium]|nr:flavin reductase family protein [Actinomycetota bacterium]